MTELDFIKLHDTAKGGDEVRRIYAAFANTDIHLTKLRNNQENWYLDSKGYAVLEVL